MSLQHHPYFFDKHKIANISPDTFHTSVFGQNYIKYNKSPNTPDYLCTIQNIINKKHQIDFHQIKELQTKAANLYNINHVNILKFYGFYQPSQKDQPQSVGDRADSVRANSVIFKDSIYSNFMFITELPDKFSINLDTFLKNETNFLNYSDLISFCVQITSALNYLDSYHNYICITLSSNTCFILPSRMKIKIPCQGFEKEGYYYNKSLSNDRVTAQSRGGGYPEEFPENLDNIRPVPYQALESMKICKFNSCSNVWTLGILFWEILSRCCHLPYQNLGFLHQDEISKYLSNSLRLNRPLSIPKNLYLKIVSLWHIEPNSRPSFSQILTWLREFQYQDIKITRDECVLSSQLTVIEYSIDATNQLLHESKIITDNHGSKHNLFICYLHKKRETKSIDVYQDLTSDRKVSTVARNFKKKALNSFLKSEESMAEMTPVVPQNFNLNENSENKGQIQSALTYNSTLLRYLP